MTDKKHGPGVRLLAELAGRSPDEVRRDPKALAEGFKALGDKATELIRDRASEDPADQARAAEEWQAMKDRLGEGPSPADTFRERLRGVLTDIRDTLADEVERAEGTEADSTARPSQECD